MNNGRLCVGKHIAEDNVITTRADETLGYIVIEAGSGTVAGIDYETALGANAITGVGNSPPDSYSLLQTYTFAVATLSAINGGWAVLFGNTPFAGNQIALAIDEDGVTFRSPSHTNYSIFADVVVNNPNLSDVSLCAWLDGEVEDYRLTFDFRRNATAVVINEVTLEAVEVGRFLDGLGMADMSKAELLHVLMPWDKQRHNELLDTSRTGTVKALHDYLDPDADGFVAILRWDTLAQQGSLGFYVERSSGDSPWQRINTELLPAMVFAPMRAEYQLADPGALSNQPYRYRLLEQEVRGSIRSYGPYSLEVKDSAGGK